MDIQSMILDYISPSIIIGTYVIFIIIKNYVQIDKKLNLIICVLIGILLGILENTVINEQIMTGFISGALSGLITLISFSTIEKFIKREN